MNFKPDKDQELDIETAPEAEIPAPDAENDDEVAQDDEALSLPDPSAAETVKPEVDLSVASFAEAGLSPELLKAIEGLGWKQPTAIQSMCLPYTVSGRDLAGFAQTGTGKTGVFLISIAHRVLEIRRKSEGKVAQPIAVVLSPTRELAMQIESDAQGLFAALGIKSLAVFGGVDYEKQARLLTEGIDVIVATPGRLKDFTQKKVVRIENCQIFVCDEADRMFDMGFIDDVKFFFDKLPEHSQRLLFSATTSENVGELAFEYLNKPKYISATPESITPERIEQTAIIADAEHKLRVMLGLLRDQKPDCAIVFTNTKITAEWLHFKLNGNGFETDLITGDLPQRKRISLIKRIKDGEVKALIATDVASRGLHIAGVTHVYNFDLPDDASNYVHRIGRTARAGAKGLAISLICEDYGDNLKAINELLGPLAMKAEWYDPSFDEIKDNAGNPFANRKPSGSRQDTGGGRQRPGQGGRKPERGGNDRNRGRGGKGEGQQRNFDRKDNRQQGRNQHGRDGQKGRGHQDRRPRQDQRNWSQQPRSVAVRQEPQSNSFFALLKRIFRTIFGRK